jgi:epoxyqueuosine reductase
VPPRVHRPTYRPVPPCALPEQGVLTRDVLDRCGALGFALAGIAHAQPTRWRDEVLAWLRAGRHGEMDYLERDLDLRFDPATVFPGTRAFIMVADVYASRNEPPPATPAPPGPHGRIARYAQGLDYHAVIKKRLHALSDALRAAYPGWGFRSFVDTVPVLERELGQRAGLGWQAKNTMIINPRLGSYMLLGGVATTLPLEPAPEADTTTDHCGTCTRCIDACPTGAITPWSVDGSRCISYLTIEHRAELDPSLHAPMGDWVYGCDVCQEVCPHNSPRPDPDLPPRHDAYRPRTERGGSLPLLEVLNWNQDARREAFRNSAMKRATLAMMKRNALIAAGNALRRRPDPTLLARINELARDPAEDPLVSATAQTVLRALAQP